MGSLAGRRVLVAGGTSGIGRGIVEHLCRAGSRVAFTGPSQRQGAATAEETGAAFVATDTAGPAAIRASAGQAAERLGGLDGLVLATGVMHEARISMTSDDEWDRIVDANLLAPLRFVQACFPLLRRNGGAIVAVASGAALWPEMELGAYSVSERALLWMVQMTAVEGAPHGVRANAVCPGDTESGMTALMNERPGRGRAGPRLPPAGRPASPADVAAAVAFLLSDDAAFCTGASLLVDGGMRAALRAHRVAS